MTRQKPSKETDRPEDTEVPPAALPDSATQLPEAASRRKRMKMDERRQAQRDALWPDTPNLHFNRRNRSRDVGFTSIPRTLSLICALIADLSNSGAASVYVDLWCRSWDDGMVVIDAEAELALASGFKLGTRHVRSWQDRMRDLQRLGFILVKPRAAHAFGYVLLVHPHFVAEQLRASGKVSDQWWLLYEERIREIGAGRVNVAQLEQELARAQGRAGSE